MNYNERERLFEARKKLKMYILMLNRNREWKTLLVQVSYLMNTSNIRRSSASFKDENTIHYQKLHHQVQYYCNNVAEHAISHLIMTSITLPPLLHTMILWLETMNKMKIVMEITIILSTIQPCWNLKLQLHSKCIIWTRFYGNRWYKQLKHNNVFDI